MAGQFLRARQWQKPNSKPSLCDSQPHSHSIILWCVSSSQNQLLSVISQQIQQRFHCNDRNQSKMKLEATQGNQVKVFCQLDHHTADLTSPRAELKCSPLGVPHYFQFYYLEPQNINLTSLPHDGPSNFGDKLSCCWHLLVFIANVPYSFNCFLLLPHFLFLSECIKGDQYLSRCGVQN